MEKDIIWHGDSLDSVKAFPLRVRRAVGTELRRLQQGLAPTSWKPMKSIGPRVREVRISIDGAFRVIYVTARTDRIHVLHAFRKKTQRTAVADIRLARQRLGLIRRRAH
ncbi:MAG TPA: type II toxin-antitoxin system RelE/ParE family toxin [Gammaproteobacteria bacterium]